ncbi:HlyD family secretion protein [Albidovulum inexpectatum]|uniref:HlyD family secretion protein n=1 Tax=Albidovulum inexpectatum TaxID=196587 RepID=A0A2S5JKX4_9RHOB|nr:efflux RND transporter periplasmic adaptor subunit [Albidovulum inexpectatum]PPB82207.1 HlyD family secretion protein [Albidovulum inexpectatum]
MKIKPRNVIPGALGAGLLLALAFVAFREDPVAVDLARIDRAPMRVTIDAEAYARVREPYEVAAPIAGKTRRAPVRAGDRVIAGETVVAVVDPAPPALLDARSREQAEAAVAEAEAALAAAQAQFRQAQEELAFARSQYDRARRLTERGVMSETQFEEAGQRLAIRIAAEEAARANVTMARSRLQRARAALIEPGTAAGGRDACCVNIRAPVTGTVLAVDIISERPVAAGTRLLTIGKTDDLEIVADLLSADAVRLPEGARALVERWGGPEPLEARLRKVEPSAHVKVSALGIEERRVDALFDLTSPPELWRGLSDGYALFLRMISWESENALQVPLSALFRRDGDWAVFRHRDGRAETVPVRIGHRNATMAEILSGLEPGDMVVLHPSDAISDGTRIAPRP